jgi:prepilin-type processing-associated H-X9-DG protein
MYASADSLGWASGTRSTLRNTSLIEQHNYALAGQPMSNASANVAANVPGSLVVGGFGSFHTGGAQFAFGDGSVRFISINVDKQLFQKLGNRADGEMLFESEYGY